IDPVNRLNDRHFEVQAGFGNWFALRFAELGDDDLLGLINGEEASGDGAQRNERKRERQNGETAALVHRFSNGFLVSGRIGKRFRIVSSMIIFSPEAGSTSPIVSR